MWFYGVWVTWILMSLIATSHVFNCMKSSSLSWWNEMWSTKEKKCLQGICEKVLQLFYIYIFVQLIKSLFSLMKDLCRFSSHSQSHMPHPVWAPWLNLVQLGNGLPPNRCANIFALHSDWLASPRHCWAKSQHQEHRSREDFNHVIGHTDTWKILGAFKISFRSAPLRSLRNICSLNSY